MKRDNYIMIVILGITLIIAFIGSALFLTGCSCVKTDKDFDIECSKCKVNYRHNIDSKNIDHKLPDSIFNKGE